MSPPLPNAEGGPRPPRVRGAALASGAAQLLGRLSGLVRDAVFTGFFGAGMAADAFFAASRVVNLLRELLAEGTLANISVPMLAEAEAKDGLAGMWALANALLGALLVALGLVTALFLVGAEPFIYLIASGFSETPEKVELAAWLVRLLSPFLALLSLASLLSGLSNVRGRFFTPALAPAALNAFVIAACLLGDRWEAATGTPAIGAVAVGTTLSGLVTIAMLLPGLRRDGFRLRPHLRGHPSLPRVARFVGAALVGIVTVQFSLLVETQLASRLGDGPVSWMMLSFRLVQVPLGVVSSSVAVASLASLSVTLAVGDREGARRGLSQALSLTSFLVLPAAVGLYLLSEPLVVLCFERGAFTHADTLATAAMLRMYALAALGICLHRVLLPVYFALQDPYLPMRLSLAVMVVKVPIALGLMMAFGVAGLPLSHAVTVSAEVAAMVLALRSRIGAMVPGFWGEQARIVLAAAGMGVGVWALRGVADGLGVIAGRGPGAAP